MATCTFHRGRRRGRSMEWRRTPSVESSVRAPTTSCSMPVTGTVTKEALDKLKIPCKEDLFANAFGYFLTNPTPRNRDRISLPKIVSLDKLRGGCSYSEENPGYRYSVWVSQQIDAVIEVDPAASGPYADFVPEPGRTVAFTAHSRGGIPVQFRFVLDRQEVSRFPGYTSNASIDDAFFEKSRTAIAARQLQGRRRRSRVRSGTLRKSFSVECQATGVWRDRHRRNRDPRHRGDGHGDGDGLWRDRQAACVREDRVRRVGTGRGARRWNHARVRQHSAR